MRRRNFLQLITYVISALAAGGMPYAIARMLAPASARDAQMMLRPPGALQDGKAFADACIGCGLCAEICPPRCIKFNKRAGGSEVNIPYINPEEKACILCGKCTEVCPTEALTKIELQDIDMGIAQIDRSACYPWVDRGICGACVSICPLGERAIGFKMWNQYQPIVHEGCVGCGLCVEVCPEPSLPIRIVERSRGTVAKHRV